MAMDEKRLTPPSGSGNWESLFNGIYRLQQRQTQKRKELTNLIRRFRNGAESLPDAVVVFRSEGNIVWCKPLSSAPSDFAGLMILVSRFLIWFVRRISLASAKDDFSELLEMRSPLT